MSGWEIALLTVVCVAFAAALGATLYRKLKGKGSDCGCGSSGGKGGCSSCPYCSSCGGHDGKTESAQTLSKSASESEPQ